MMVPSDGTTEAVRKNYPKVNVLQGTGELYWAGGMRNSWNAALKGNYDGYLLLNDDTEIYTNALEELLTTHNFSVKSFDLGGIYVGTTKDKESNKLTYGGNVLTNRFLAKYKRVIPNDKIPQECELGNANIMLVSKEVIDKIGILTKGFAHGLADFDYTLKAKKNKIPVLITPSVLGICTYDHTNPYITFHELTFKERLKKLYSPIGLDFKSNILYMSRNFPIRLPFVLILGYFKVLFPKFYFKYFVKKRIDLQINNVNS